MLYELLVVRKASGWPMTESIEYMQLTHVYLPFSNRVYPPTAYTSSFLQSVFSGSELCES